MSDLLVRIEKDIEEIFQKLDLLPQLDRRLTVLEHDVNGNGSPGWKDVISDLTVALKDFTSWKIEWEKGVDDSDRAKTCLWVRNHEAAEEIMASLEDRRERARKKWTLAVVISAFCLVTIPSSLVLWSQVRDKAYQQHIEDVLEKMEEEIDSSD